MTKLADLYKSLGKIASTQTATYASDFEHVLSQIGEHNDPNSIVELIRFFDDDAQFDEVMFSIVHLIETFEDEIYVSKLLESSKQLYNNSPRWASILFMRVLNSENSRAELIRQLQYVPPDTKSVIRHLMEKINSRSANFLAKTAPVLIAVSS